MGHVGNFTLAKNHGFILQVARELFLRKPDSRLVLVGDGRLRSDIEEQARMIGIADKIVFTGKRADVPRLMGMMDVFLFPSLYEGLPLVVVEAQAAGLPIVIADSVSAETEFVSELFTWLSLSLPPAYWAEKCLELVGQKNCLAKLAPCQILEQSSFNIATNWLDLDRFYTGQTA
jgi:glycosyltransferase involved in cell wall biosynthesis